jgi:oligopeptide transport system permease protein
VLRYSFKRFIIGFVTLFVIVSVTFFLLQILPGSPFNDDKLTAEQVEMLNEAYGLDSPVVVQYARYMGHVLQGDFGTSFRYDNQKVSDLISKKLVYTTQIGVQSLIFGVFVGIFLGALAAIRKDSIWDHFTTIVAIIGVSIPSFVMGPLLQLLFGVKLGWLPVIFITDNWLSTILPSFALSLFVISSTARFMRTELVEVLGTDYILLARAKGLKDGQVVFKHAIRNALIPVITIVGPMTITLLTGSLVIERIFGVPGVSFLMIDGIMRNDYFIILGVATFYSALYIIILIITDIMYGVIDPRIRVSGGGK